MTIKLFVYFWRAYLFKIIIREYIGIGNARGSWQEQEALISLRREAPELLS